MASTSIPNIFPAFPWLFQDGIHYLTDPLLTANDPVTIALIYTDMIYPKTPKLLVSFGSGIIDAQSTLKTNPYQGLIQGPSTWIKMIFQGNEDKLNALMEELRKHNGFGLEFYFRFNPRLPQSESDHLNASAQNIFNLTATADAYIIKHSQEIDQVVHLLLTTHGVAT